MHNQFHEILILKIYIFSGNLGRKDRSKSKDREPSLDSAGQRSKVKKTKSTLGSGGNGNADQNKFHSMTSLTMSSTTNDNDLKEENLLNTTNESDVEHGGNFLLFFRPPKKIVKLKL